MPAYVICDLGPCNPYLQLYNIRYLSVRKFSTYHVVAGLLLLCRVVSVLGYVPQDLVGEVSYQYYHPDDLHRMVQLHQNGQY